MRRTALASLALAFTLLAGTTGANALELAGLQGGRYRLAVTSLKEARFKSTIRQHYDFSCGSAAVATLLTYQYGQPVSEEAVFAQMYAHGDQAKIRKEGFSLLDIKRYLGAHGYAADGFEVPLEKLAENRLPAIVLISSSGYHHFVVVKGLVNGRVLIGDPATGTHAMSRRRFEAIWEDHILFVVHNRRELARFNDPADWRVAPGAPLQLAIIRDGLGHTVLPKHGPGDI
ncbi:MAG: C39 family peptidase [Mizugakiibacter sp.]|uniref:C39 family peptidase n=1 Tax=Mizugakiibacter sp. TaxID=1972610 RepID=UPI0031BC78E1|nr:C39 family peptidase [Xanthomonadaceae bacterium]